MKTVRPTTARSYRQHVEKLLIPAMGDIALSKLRADHVVTAYDKIQAEHPTMGPTAMRRMHATLSSALNEAVKARRIDFNPAAHVHLPRAPRPKVKPWEPAELGKFLDHAAGHREGILSRSSPRPACAAVKRSAFAGPTSTSRPA